MFSVKEDYFSEIIECHVASKLNLEIEMCMLVSSAVVRVNVSLYSSI